MNTELYCQLAAPFAPDDVKWKPQAISGQRCLAIAYVNARAIMDRLDEVLTPAGWQDEYSVLADGSVMCKLSVRLGDDWITKADVGSQSEQPDEGDRMKAGFSDALKRAAVKLGVGRYLYRLPSTWVEYDPQKRAMKHAPKLPDWALPGNKPAIATNALTRPSEPAIGAGTPSKPIATNAVLHAADLADDEDRRINADEEKQLVQLLKSTQANVDRFMKHFGIRSVGSLPARNLPEALEMLRRKAAAGSGGSAATSQAPKAPANGVATPKGTGKGGAT